MNQRSFCQLEVCVTLTPSEKAVKYMIDAVGKIDAVRKNMYKYIFSCKCI